MGCGCKKKKVNPTTLNQERNKVIIAEGAARSVPEVLKPPPPSEEPDVDQVINKLKNILIPKN